MERRDLAYFQPRLLVPVYLPLYLSQNFPFFLSLSSLSLSFCSSLASSNPIRVQLSFFNAHVEFHPGSHSSIGAPAIAFSAFHHAEYCRPGPGYQPVTGISPVTLSPSGCLIFVSVMAAEMSWGQTVRQLTFWFSRQICAERKLVIYFPPEIEFQSFYCKDFDDSNARSDRHNRQRVDVHILISTLSLPSWNSFSILTAPALLMA